MRLDCDDGTVIHYSTSLKIGRVRIMRVSTSKFANGQAICMEFCNTNYSPDEIVRRAKERLGEQIYHLLGNNCENCLYWCTTDKSKSYQVENAKNIINTAASGVLGVMTAGIPVAGAVAEGATIYHRLRMLGNWDDR